jgi:uncharacterized damage-inducible protein DinB
MNTISKEFIEQSVIYINENLPRIEKCLNELNNDEVWKRPNSSSNSIGNLVLHLCGNITQWIISGLGKEHDKRNRDSEFEASSGYTANELKEKISSTISKAVSIIKNLDEDGLTSVKSVQGNNYSGIAIIVHVTEHLSYHTGQITFWTKCLKDKDMGYYAGKDLNKKNNP